MVHGGQGSVYRTSDGRWRAKYVAGVRPDGKPDVRYLSSSVTSKRPPPALLRRLRDKVEARDNGSLDAGRPMTVQAWLTYWLDDVFAVMVAEGSRSPRTLQDYRQLVRDYALPVIGQAPMDRLSAEHVEKVLAGMRAAGCSPARLRVMLACLSSAFTVAERRGRMARNPARLVQAPAGAATAVDPLSAQEARAILAASVRWREPARWSVALAVGLRQGEALGLSWDDVDTRTGVVVVRWQLQRIDGVGFVLRAVKGKRARVIRLPGSLRAELEAHRRRQVTERLELGPAWRGWTFEGREVPLVFARPDGMPWEPKYDRDRWHKIVAAAGVERTKLHNARHTAATLMLVNGVPARVVQEILGHADQSMTNRYLHVVPELSEGAAAAMDAALWDTPEGSSDGTSDGTFGGAAGRRWAPRDGQREGS